MSGRLTGMIWTSCCRFCAPSQARATGPMLIHVITKKGKGYAPAEAARDKGHATGKFDVLTGRAGEGGVQRAELYQGFRAKPDRARPSADDKIVAVTAAMPDGTGLEPVRGTVSQALLRRGHCRTACRDLLRRVWRRAG